MKLSYLPEDKVYVGVVKRNVHATLEDDESACSCTFVLRFKTRDKSLAIIAEKGRRHF